jgi:hypothetical protein
MKEANNITVTYEKPKKYWFVIEFGNGKYDCECLKVCDTYDEAIKSAHEYNKENSKEYYYIVCESKFYTGSKTARFWGMEFEDNIDNGDMV